MSVVLNGIEKVVLSPRKMAAKARREASYEARLRAQATAQGRVLIWIGRLRSVPVGKGVPVQIQEELWAAIEEELADLVLQVESALDRFVYDISDRGESIKPREGRVLGLLRHVFGHAR